MNELPEVREARLRLLEEKIDEAHAALVTARGQAAILRHDVSEAYEALGEAINFVETADILVLKAKTKHG